MGKLKGTMKTCKICKNKFYVRPYRSKTAEYCSRSCLAKDKLAKFVPIHGFQKSKKIAKRYLTTMVNGKQVRIHRNVMEEHLGRKLERWEHVHHINGDEQDNRLENLVVISHSEHSKEHAISRLLKYQPC